MVLPMGQSSPRPTRAQERFWQLTGRSLPQALVSFVIPDLDRDIEGGMYLTMKLAESHHNPIVSAMYSTARGFFSTLADVLDRARGGDMIAHRIALRMASFPEAWEIGMGYTTKGWGGRGVGSGSLCHYVVDELLGHPGMALACAEEPDALTMIHNVGLDRSSDALATVCKRHLIQFTQEQARVNRFRPSCMGDAQVGHIWDPGKGGLVSATERLPLREDGRPILLVPKEIVRSSPPVRAHHYGRTYGIQGEPKAIKRQAMEENRHNPDRLLRAMRRVFENPKNYRPRRDFRA